MWREIQLESSGFSLEVRFLASDGAIAVDANITGKRGFILKIGNSYKPDDFDTALLLLLNPAEELDGGRPRTGWPKESHR